MDVKGLDRNHTNNTFGEISFVAILCIEFYKKIVNCGLLKIVEAKTGKVLILNIFRHG